MTITLTIRREWRTLTKSEQTLFLNTVLKLMERSDNDHPSFYDLHAKLLGDNSQAIPAENIKKGGLIHGTPLFLPWYRYFLFLFEKQLQIVEPKLALPYWSFGLDANNPELAPVWGEEAFGGNGVGEDSAVLDGFFKNWQPLYPTPHHLRRSWSAGNAIDPFESPEVTHAQIIRARMYDELRKALEMRPAGIVRNNIGGDCLTMYAANDPLFYLFMANIDRLWFKWQLSSTAKSKAFDGLMPQNKQKVSLSDPLPHFSGSVKVSDVIEAKILGYTYDEVTI
ncbi:MAG TPA: tyrosinase family protein [Thiolinea sp.]|nr:tyrosinase family protein [Thiolinea sp.]